MTLPLSEQVAGIENVLHHLSPARRRRSSTTTTISCFVPPVGHRPGNSLGRPGTGRRHRQRRCLLHRRSLGSAKAGEADTLIAISFPDQARIYLQQALEEEHGTQSLDLIDGLPGLGGSKRTGAPVISLDSLRDDVRAR